MTQHYKKESYLYRSPFDERTRDVAVCTSHGVPNREVSMTTKQVAVVTGGMGGIGASTFSDDEAIDDQYRAFMRKLVSYMAIAPAPSPLAMRWSVATKTGV